VDYMNGPSATVHEEPLEYFRRTWSGYALVPDTTGYSQIAFGLIGFAVSFIPLFLIARKQTSN
jgi:hypothetical protein